MVEKLWILECETHNLDTSSSKGQELRCLDLALDTHQQYDREIHATLHNQNPIHPLLASQYHRQSLESPQFRSLHTDKIDSTACLPLFESLSMVCRSSEKLILKEKDSICVNSRIGPNIRVCTWKPSL